MDPAEASPMASPAAAPPTPPPPPPRATPPPSDRVTVAVDLDEVLGAFVEALASWHNAEHGTTLTVDSFHSYHFRDVWGDASDDVTRAKMTAFFASSHFDGIAPLRTALDTLRELHASHCRFVLVTSRDLALESRTRAWLDVHYAGVFDEVRFGNHYGLTGPKRTKSEICAELGASVLIDDSLSYALEAAPSVPLVILFGQYTWNSGPRKVHGEPAVTAAAASAGAADAGAAAPAAGAAAPSGGGSSSSSSSSSSAGGDVNTGGGGSAGLSGVAGKPGAPPPGPVHLPSNVLRAINWQHAGAILRRLRPSLSTPPPGAGSGAAGGPRPPRTAAAAMADLLSTLARRDALAVSHFAFARSGGAQQPGHAYQQQQQQQQPGGSGGGRPPQFHRTAAAFYADVARRSFELCGSVTVTGSGEDAQLAAETAALLERVGDAVIADVRTGADSARPVPGAARAPRLTLTLTRAPGFLTRRFEGARSLGLVAAVSAAAAPGARGDAAVGGDGGAPVVSSDALSPIAKMPPHAGDGVPPAAVLQAAREEAAAALSAATAAAGSEEAAAGPKE